MAPGTLWPWIAQLGQGRGGFYSYDFLENLVGCDVHSATRVHPEWQQVAVGTEVRLAPQVPLVVVAIEPGAALVLRGGIPMGAVAPPYDFTWSFLVRLQPGSYAVMVSALPACWAAVSASWCIVAAMSLKSSRAGLTPTRVNSRSITVRSAPQTSARMRRR